MKRSFWTTLILVTGVCAVVMVALAARNKRLSNELATGKAVPPTRAPAIASKSNRTPSPPLSSEERIERASEGVNRFIASLVPLDGSRAKELAKGSDGFRGGTEESAGRRIMFWENLPDLLRSVKGLSVDELLAVAADLPAKKENSDIFGDTRAHLIMLAAEQDPMRVLQDEKLMEGLDEVGVLRCLAMVDPAEAVRLEPEIMSSKDVYYREDRERLGATLLGSDVDLGLQLFLEMRENDPDREEGMQALNGGLEMGLIALRPEAIPKLAEAMDNPEFEGIRNDIIKTMLDHHLSEGGLAATAREASAMGLTSKEIGLYLDSAREELIATSPEATVNWMSRALPAGEQSRRVPEAVVAWANRDIDAAADWLGKQEPSPVLDQTIARFATEASELDAEGAAAWAREIQDEQLREETLREVADK